MSKYIRFLVGTYFTSMFLGGRLGVGRTDSHPLPIYVFKSMTREESEFNQWNEPLSFGYGASSEVELPDKKTRRLVCLGKQIHKTEVELHEVSRSLVDIIRKHKSQRGGK